jgi:hypothetical protein
MGFPALRYIALHYKRCVCLFNGGGYSVSRYPKLSKLSLTARYPTAFDDPFDEGVWQFHRCHSEFLFRRFICIPPPATLSIVQ